MSTNEAALPQSTVRVAQADPDGISGGQTFRSPCQNRED